MITIYLWALIICAAINPSFVEASGFETIRVAIADNQRTVKLEASSGLRQAGARHGARKEALHFNAESVGGKPARVTSNNAFIRVNGKRYRGWLEIRKKKNGLLLVVNELDLEEYVRGVVAAEVPSDWEYEALKAQAVVSRTYALHEKRTTGKRPYHVLATVSSQVYNGVDNGDTRAARAVRETEGLVLTYRGKVIPAFYHANCGGHTENASELWGLDAPYLKGVDCECQKQLHCELWEKRIPVSRVAEALRRRGHAMDDIRDMSIAGLTPAGRAKAIAVRFGGGAITVPSELLRTALGNTELPSVFFELELSNGEAVFSGRGKGHGVGLCQWGAKEMAGQGRPFQSILAHYYPGTVIEMLE